MSYTNLVYHIVFRTYRSIPAIDEEHERELYAYAHGYITRHRAKLYRIGGMPDHVHLLVSLPPDLAPRRGGCPRYASEIRPSGVTHRATRWVVSLIAEIKKSGRVNCNIFSSFFIYQAPQRGWPGHPNPLLSTLPLLPSEARQRVERRPQRAGLLAVTGGRTVAPPLARRLATAVTGATHRVVATHRVGRRLDGRSRTPSTVADCLGPALVRDTPAAQRRQRQQQAHDNEHQSHTPALTARHIQHSAQRSHLHD